MPNDPNVFIHPHALVESGATLGPRTRVWAFAHILPGAVIGADCNLCDHVFIENRVRVGDRVTIKCGVQLWDGVTLEDDVFVGPNATFTNDPFPRSRHHLAEYPETIVRKGATIGANATILPGITIGREAMVGAGAVVTRDVPDRAIVTGVPARITGYVGARGKEAVARTNMPTEVGVCETAVRGVKIFRQKEITDLRGKLSVGEFPRSLPFVPRRYYLIYGVPSREVRGEHAHRTLHQFLLCLAGQCALIVDDGSHREEIVLDSPAVGVYRPPMIWGVQYKFSADAVLLVLASDPYDPNDYIRDYEQFLAEIQSQQEVAP